MKVVMVNGSRREKGCTYTALNIIAKVLADNGIESQIIHVGEKAVNGQIDQIVNEVAEAVKTADGFIVGSPVYYASPSGEVIAFLDRLWGVAEADLRFKPATSIASARRGGTTATLDVLNKYFMFSQMPVVSSRYWNIIHGSNPEQTIQDTEGVQIMETVGRNMAWLLKSIEAGKKAGVVQPVAEQKVFFNYVR